MASLPCRGCGGSLCVAALLTVGRISTVATVSRPGPGPAWRRAGQGRQAYSSVDAMADYTMMDTEDMYALMADADN
jgi:hypothetical protein